MRLARSSGIWTVSSMLFHPTPSSESGQSSPVRWPKKIPFWGKGGGKGDEGKGDGGERGQGKGDGRIFVRISPSVRHSTIMHRRPRVVFPGVAHHITQRGNDRQPVFFSSDDRRFYLDLLTRHAFRHTHSGLLPDDQSRPSRRRPRSEEHTSE